MIEALRTSILEPHDRLYINHERTLSWCPRQMHVSAETACENMHKALPRKRRRQCCTAEVGARLAAIEGVYPNVAMYRYSAGLAVRLGTSGTTERVPVARSGMRRAACSGEVATALDRADRSLLGTTESRSWS